MDKAKKGTPQYEEWLRRYREKKAGKTSQPQEQKQSASDQLQKPKQLSAQHLLDAPPTFVDDKETWRKAVMKLTYGGEKQTSYPAAVRLYKLKKEKKAKESIG